MKKNVIRLNKSQLVNIIKESVARVLKENDENSLALENIYNKIKNLIDKGVTQEKIDAFMKQNGLFCVSYGNTMGLSGNPYVVYNNEPQDQYNDLVEGIYCEFTDAETDRDRYLRKVELWGFDY